MKYFNISEWKILEFEQAYSPLNVRQELEKMDQWLDANPRRRKKKYQRFVVNWLGKAHAKVISDQVNARLYARAGVYDTQRKPADYQAECEEILKRYPDLA